MELQRACAEAAQQQLSVEAALQDALRNTNTLKAQLMDKAEQLEVIH
jgi:hypothetical protein